jgi:hypothetical protein
MHAFFNDIRRGRDKTVFRVLFLESVTSRRAMWCVHGPRAKSIALQTLMCSENSARTRVVVFDIVIQQRVAVQTARASYVTLLANTYTKRSNILNAHTKL